MGRLRVPPEIARLKDPVRAAASGSEPQSLEDNPPLGPEPPPGLGPGELAAYAEIRRNAAPLELLRQSDRTALELLARALALYRQALQRIALHGTTAEDGQLTGDYRVMVRERQALIRLLRETGMTPAARAALLAAPGQPTVQMSIAHVLSHGRG